MSAEFFWLAVATVTIISSSRITRLLTFDDFPPIRWFRNTYADIMDKHTLTRGWVRLLFCPWCFSFYPTLAIVLWGYFTDFQPAWWLVNGAFAASYLAAIFMVNDTDDSGDEQDADDTTEGDI